MDQLPAPLARSEIEPPARQAGQFTEFRALLEELRGWSVQDHGLLCSCNVCFLAGMVISTWSRERAALQAERAKVAQELADPTPSSPSDLELIGKLDEIDRALIAVDGLAHR